MKKKIAAALFAVVAVVLIGFKVWYYFGPYRLCRDLGGELRDHHYCYLKQGTWDMAGVK